MAIELPTAQAVVDARALTADLAEAERLSRSFGASLGAALESGVVRGNALGDVLRTLGLRLSAIALQSALKPVETAFGSIFSSLTRGAFGGLGSPLSGAGLGTPGTLGGGLMPIASAASSDRAPAAAPKPAPVTVNISTPDADSFRRSEAQVTASLARAVARGRRGL